MFKPAYLKPDSYRFGLPRFGWLAALLLLLAAPSFAQSDLATETSGTQDEEKTLGKVVVQGRTFDMAQPLPEGDFIVSPDLVTRVNDESGRSIPHAFYELVLSPVEVGYDGFITPDPDPRRTDEVLRPQLREKNPRTGSHIKFVPPSYYKMRLREGLYALTQVRYRVQTRLTIIEDPTQAAAVTDFEIESSLEDIEYCLANGTLLIDIEKDRVSTFGKLIIRGLFRDRDTFAEHFPIAAVEAPTTRPADGRIFDKDPDPVSWGVGRFDPDSGLCANTTDFITAGWAISENWTW